MRDKKQEANAQYEFACNYCDKEFKYPSEKTRHEQSHSTRFECKVCCKTFGFQSALRRHEKQHQRTGTVECKECKRSFRDDILLKRHIKYAHTGVYTCSECLSTFSSEAALNTHLKVHKPKAERQYHCSHLDCDKSFNFPHHLKHHELTHTNSKQHFCSTCGKGFIQSHHLKIHLKTHEPENWLLCPRPGCGKKFTTEYARRRHLATHKPKPERKPASRSFAFAIEAIEESIELAETTKDGLLCSSCGDMVSKNKLPSHALKCIKDNEEVPSHGSPVKLKQEDVDTEPSILENESNHNKEDENLCFLDNNQDQLFINDHKAIVEEPASINQDVDIEYIDFTNDCKSVLGGCLMSGSSQNEENCICAKMSPSIQLAKTLEVSVKKNDYAIKKAKSSSHKDLTDCDDTNNECKGCDCAGTLQTKQYVEKIAAVPKKCSKYQETMPKIQYRLDGVIKIEETFDITIATVRDGGLKKAQVKKNATKKKKEISVPLNSCKDVLGNCIVSGNDTIGEGCLCARMAMETQQATAQEIEEISICFPADRSGKEVATYGHL